MSILLSTVNFQLTIYQSAKKGGCVILGPYHYIVYTFEMNKQVSCFQISIWSGMISQSDSGWLWHYPFLFREWLGILKPPWVFCFLDNVRKIPDNLHVYSGWPRKHLCLGNHLVVLKIYMYKTKRKERKKTRKSSLVMFLFVWLRQRLASRALSTCRPSIIPKMKSIVAS